MASNLRFIYKSVPDYVSIDTETTGLTLKEDRIIEIAAVRVRNGEICDTFSTLINPHFPINRFLTELTGITNSMLKNAPDLSQVLPSAIEFIGDDIIIGHNVSFDVKFLNDALEGELYPKLDNKCIDTMKISRRLFPSYPHHKLSDLINRFGIADTVEHRALSDAIQAHRCYEYMKKHMTDNGITDISLERNKQNKVRASEITTGCTCFDENSPIYNKLFVFTGTLSIDRRIAMQKVVDKGGRCKDSVTNDVDYLVIGDNGGSISSKERKARSMIGKGMPIIIIDESIFSSMLEK